MALKSDITKANRTSAVVAFPEVILIDNCNACNLSYTMCDHKNMTQYRKVQLMDIEIYQRLNDEIAVENPESRVLGNIFRRSLHVPGYGEEGEICKG